MHIYGCAHWLCTPLSNFLDPPLLLIMATKSQFNIYTTYYESFLVLSVSIRVDKHQLTMETRQAPLLRYKDITLTTEYLKECLTAVCPLLGVHNVARVRQGALPLFEVDFMDEKALSVKCCLTVCTTSSCMYTADNSHNIPGEIQARLQDQLERNIFLTKYKLLLACLFCDNFMSNIKCSKLKHSTLFD